MAMTKAEIAKELVDKVGFDSDEALCFVNDFFKTIIGTLESGEHVKLSGFGNFMLNDKPERPGRNPKTKEPVLIKPRRVVTFKPGVKLRQRFEPVGEKNG